MKIAIMQPYIFPYIGYFQLIHAVDKFIFYDDVGFIKQGWINKNNILLNKNKHTFIIPVQNISSFTNIKNTLISENPTRWNTKLSATLKQAYQKAPYFDDVSPIVDKILRGCVNRSIGDVAAESIEGVLNYIGLKKTLTHSFERYNNTHLKLADRVVDICHQEQADTYINAIGGQAFYTKAFFKEHDINLNFIKPNLTIYPQNAPEFMAGLSILDVLMYNEPAKVKVMLEYYSLL
jgi:WbqC-like protein family